jgi:hypothetical protein
MSVFEKGREKVGHMLAGLRGDFNREALKTAGQSDCRCILGPVLLDCSTGSAQSRQVVATETNPMKDTLLVFAFIALTFFCWGAYGPVLHNGQVSMHGSRLRPLLCVGLAYFAIAVVVPIVMLSMYGEKGTWTAGGIIWSLLGGALGAIGALGIILAFNFGGRPAYVMPLVFGFAPVVNAFLTVGINRAYREMSPALLGGMIAGIIMVAVGGFLVLFCATQGRAPHATPAHRPAVELDEPASARSYL